MGTKAMVVGLAWVVSATAVLGQEKSIRMPVIEDVKVECQMVHGETRTVTVQLKTAQIDPMLYYELDFRNAQGQTTKFIDAAFTNTRPSYAVPPGQYTLTVRIMWGTVAVPNAGQAVYPNIWVPATAPSPGGRGTGCQFLPPGPRK